MPIEGLVAQIVSEREIAINVGSEHGVEQGMRFAILASAPLEVRDPRTGDELGIIDREKVKVQATEVHATFTICATYETRQVGSGLLLGSSISELFGPSRVVPKTLKVGDQSGPPPLTPEDSYVKIGDRVKELTRVYPQPEPA